MRNLRLFRTLEATAVLLFLLQSVRVLFSVLFGLIYDTVFSGTMGFSALALVMLCVLVAFLVPLVAPRRDPRALSFATALVAALARVPLTINVPAVRLWSSLLVVAAAGMYIVGLLQTRPRVFPIGLVLALAADQFLRAAGDTFDVGLRSWWLPVQVGVSLAVGGLAWLAFSRSRSESPPEEGIGVLGGLAVGALLFLETSLLGFPNALARWSGVRYAVVAPLLMAVTLLAAVPGARRTIRRFLQGGLGGLGLLALALAGLAGGRVVGGCVGLTGMLVAQFLLLVVPSGLAGRSTPTRRRERVGVALGMLLFLVLNFALAFAFTYPYTVPAFRDTGLYTFLAAATVACLPGLRPPHATPEIPEQKLNLWHWLAALLAVSVVVVFAWPPTVDAKESGPVRVGTYNIHYGYDTGWRLSLEQQARTIQESGADIVMLQEVDACRITSYGVDDALWLARRLGMDQVYGPALEGLSGIALLTRFPIAEAEAQLLTSHLEQTAIVHARVMVEDRSLHAYGVWMGLEPEERARQLDDVFAVTRSASPAVLGGDFNATPDSPTYARVRAAGFDDPFIVGGFNPAPTSPAIRPAERIDFVWARGLDVRDARVLDSLASDHRMVLVELSLP